MGKTFTSESSRQSVMFQCPELLRNFEDEEQNCVEEPSFSADTVSELCLQVVTDGAEVIDALFVNSDNVEHVFIDHFFELVVIL